MQLFQNSRVFAAFQSELDAALPVWLRVDKYLDGLKDRLPDLLKKVERFRAVFG